MQENLKRLSKKYHISTTKTIHDYLPENSGKASAVDWVNRINDFLEKHNLDDADIEIILQGYDSYLENIAITAIIDKSDDELRDEIRVCQAAEDKNKNKEELKERELYEKLKKKYG